MIAIPFYLLAAIALLVLRRTEPHTARPFQNWIGTPVLFAIVAIGLLVFGAMESPWEAFASFGLLWIGSFVWIARHSERGSLWRGIRSSIGSCSESFIRLFDTLFRPNRAYKRQNSQPLELDEL